MRFLLAVMLGCCWVAHAQDTPSHIQTGVSNRVARPNEAPSTNAAPAKDAPAKDAPPRPAAAKTAPKAAPAKAAGDRGVPKSAAPVPPEYLKLQDWGEKAQLVFTRQGEEIRLTNRWANLGFKLNSARAEVDGISVFLAHPILTVQGAVCIAQRDVDKTLRPLLFPAKTQPRQTLKIIAISAGHGGKDSGYRVGSHLEKHYTLLLARELEERVADAGMKPLLIRDSDQFIDLAERTQLARRGGADVLIELHYNCAGPGNTESGGLEVYCLTPDGATSTNGGGERYPGLLPGNRQDERNILLAYHMQRSLLGTLSMADRGVRRARFVVLREASMPAVLIEAGFMSRPEELRRIEDPLHRRQTAQAILDGLLAYKRLIER